MARLSIPQLPMMKLPAFPRRLLSAIGYHHVVMLVLTLAIISNGLLLAGCTSSSSFGRNMYILSLSYKGGGTSVESSTILDEISQIIANATTGEFEVRTSYFGLCIRNIESWSCQSKALTLGSSNSDPLQILGMVHTFKTEVLFPGLLIGSAVLAAFSWLLLATFPGWHSEIDDNGSEIDVKPFPNRTVVNITLGTTTLAMLFAFVSAVWQHTSTATASTLIRVSAFGLLQAKTGPIATAMVWINLSLLLLATLMMVIMILSLKAMDGILDRGDEEKLIIEEENMMSGSIQGKKGTPLSNIKEEKAYSFSDNRNYPMRMPPPPPPPSDFRTGMPPPPPPGFRMNMSAPQPENTRFPTYSTGPVQPVVHSPAQNPSVRDSPGHDQSARDLPAQDPLVQDSTVEDSASRHVPGRNDISDLTDRHRQDSETRPTNASTSKPETNAQIDATEAEIEELEASLQRLQTQEKRVSKQSVSSDEETHEVGTQRPLLLPPPPTSSVQTTETRPQRTAGHVVELEENLLKQTPSNTAPNSPVTTTAQQPQANQSTPIEHVLNDAQVAQTRETRPNETFDDLYDLSD